MNKKQETSDTDTEDGTINLEHGIMLDNKSIESIDNPKDVPKTITTLDAGTVLLCQYRANKSEIKTVIITKDKAITSLKNQDKQANWFYYEDQGMYQKTQK